MCTSLSQSLDRFATEDLLSLVDVRATVPLRARMAARASPIAIKPSVAVLVTGFVFAERDVLFFARTRDLVTMVGEEGFGESLEATFGRARSLFGHALLASV